MRRLLRPRWIVLFTVTALLVTLFVFLGFWQRSRLDDRRERNAVIAARLEAAPVELGAVVERAAETLDIEALEYTTVRLSGRVLGDEILLVRNETHRGQAGFHVIAPVDLGGQVVLVNAGWVPLTTDADTAGRLFSAPFVDVTGLVRATELRPAVGREEPDGVLTEINRVDIDRLQFQFDEPLLPFWVQATTSLTSGEAPILVAGPDLGDGPHLSYMVQWWSFAAIAAGGVVALARREVARRPLARAQAGSG